VNARQGDLIRCPDWEALAPPVVAAGGGNARAARVFETRTRRTAARTASAAKAPETAPETTPSGRASRDRPSCGHTVSAGDTLGGIAAARLGGASRWREVAAANPGVDPRLLRIGATLRVPCGSAAAAGEGGAGTPPARVADPEPSAAGTPADAAPGDAPGLPPPPLWTAARGEFLADVLTRWGGAAGWTVIVDTTDAWRLAVAFRTRSAFDAAVAELVRGLGHDGVPPRVRLYPNRVLRLGGPL